jgi:hypothetical protein
MAQTRQTSAHGHNWSPLTMDCGAGPVPAAAAAATSAREAVLKPSKTLAGFGIVGERHSASGLTPTPRVRPVQNQVAKPLNRPSGRRCNCQWASLASCATALCRATVELRRRAGVVLKWLPCLRPNTPRKKPPRRPKRAPNALAQPVRPDPSLAAIVGPEPLPRTELTRRVWAYIRERQLQDAQD